MSSDMLDVSSVHLIHQIVSYAVSPRHFQTFPDHWCMHIICDGAADFYVSGGSYTATFINHHGFSTFHLTTEAAASITVRAVRDTFSRSPVFLGASTTLAGFSPGSMAPY